MPGSGGRSLCRPVDASPSRQRRPASRTDAGFSLAEVIIALLVTVTGLLSLAQLLAVTAKAEGVARNGALAARMGQDKLDDLMKANFDTSPSLQLTPVGTDTLAANVPNYFDQPAPAVTRRWIVRQGPAGTRILTVRVLVVSGASPRTVDLTTLVRRW
jgi:Tfp pilus assembly protein PilV